VRSVKLIDFGINYLLTEHVGAFGELSRAQVFIASELQQKDPEATELSDIYSLGLLLLEMISPEPLTAATVPLCLDAAWTRCPELAMLVDDMIDRKPENRLLDLCGGASVFRVLPSKIVEAVQTHVHVNSRRPSSIEILLKSLTGVPIDILVELFRRTRTIPKSSSRPELRWVLSWGFLVQGLGIVALIAFINFTIWSYDFRGCEALGICISERDNPPLPLGDGALLGRVNSLLPGRLVALSFAVLLTKYYVEVFGSLTTWRLHFSRTRRLTRLSEIVIRSFPVLSMAPIFYALVVDPKAWPFCSALGLAFTSLTNWVVYSLATRVRSSAAATFDLPHSPFVADQIATFGHWWKTIFLYLGSMVILGFVVRAGLAQDEWLYAIFVSVFANILIMYRHHCSEAAPAVRSALQRLIWTTKRLELKERRRTTTAGQSGQPH
jgi:hypothetical protein